MDMKRFLLSFLFLISLLDLQAQVVFCPPGAKWTYEFDNGFFSGTSHNESVMYFKDSVVDNENVKILWSSWFFTHYNPTGATGQTYIKQNGDTVFMRNKWTNHQWQILYNFAAQVGHSWTNNFPGVAQYTTTVDSVNTIAVGGNSLKRLWVSYTNYLAIPYHSQTTTPYSGTITERYGSNRFIFNYLCGVNRYNSNWREFLCYTDNETGEQKFGVKPCNYSNAVGLEEQYLFGLKIYPNPVDNLLSIEGAEGSTILLSDVNGRIVKEEILRAEKINTSGLNPGVYFLQVKHEGECVYKTKIVKE